LIAAKDVLLAGVAKVTGLNVEKDLYLPWAERVTVHSSAEEFLHQAVKSRQHDFAVLYGINHPTDLIGGTYGKLNASNGSSPNGSFDDHFLSMKNIFTVLLIGGILSLPGFAESKVPAGSKLFIAPMEGSLDGFIAPEIIKKKLPITVVTDEKDADFVVAGGSIKADDKWYNTVFGGKDKNEGNVRLLSVKDKSMVWAGEAGDRSLIWAGLRRGGERKVADRIVSQMKKDLFSK